MLTGVAQVDGAVKGKSGSEHIVRHLRNNGKEVVAMMNFDSIGSPLPEGGCNPLGAELNSIIVFGDPAQPELSNNIDPSTAGLFFNCVDQYTEEPWKAQYGANGASDHLSFIGWKYPASGAVESNIVANGLNECGFDLQRHHTSRDTPDGVDVEYVKQFARAALGFVIEASASPTGDGPRFESPASCSSPASPTASVPASSSGASLITPPLVLAASAAFAVLRLLA